MEWRLLAMGSSDDSFPSTLVLSSKRNVRSGMILVLNDVPSSLHVFKRPWHHDCRGRPTLRCSVSLGSAKLDEKVDWCSGCCRSLLKTWPNNFNFLSWRTSVSGLIFLSVPSAGAFKISFALRNTYSLELRRWMKVVCSFRIFLSPFNWNESSNLPADSVGSKVSKP